MRERNQEEVPAVRVLYDKDTLERLRDEYGDNPTAIKRAVDTRAFTYEIRTAMRYWFGGKADYRTSDRIWDRCEAVENGLFSIVNDELRYPDEVDL